MLVEQHLPITDVRLLLLLLVVMRAVDALSTDAKMMLCVSLKNDRARVRRPCARCHAKPSKVGVPKQHAG